MTVEITKLKITKDENFQRSAAAPVGIVAAVSMNTIWNRKVVATPEVKSESGWSPNPVRPKRPNGFPNSVTVSSWERIGSPPNTAPTPPIWRPKPTRKNPMMPIE